MDELESRINSVLGDPEQMEKITKLAQSIMSGSGQVETSAASEVKGLDTEMLRRISKLMSADSAKDKNERALLEAISPYLSEKRRSKMNRALKIAKLARLAGIAMEEREGDA